MLMTRKGIRSQSAMEFLTTYGWAILIITVAFVTLFSLGVFNQFSFAPRAQTGSCYMYRPFGAYNIKLISLQGTCSGMLPQYVAYVAGNGGWATMTLTNGLKPSKVTVSLWFLEPSYGSTCYASGGAVAGGSFTYGYEILLPASCDMSAGLIIGSGLECWVAKQPTIGKWMHVVGTFDGSNIVLYYNGASVNTGSCGALSYTGVAPYVFYVPSGDNVYLSNIQIYNASLSASEVQALYKEGIGGAPLSIQNLVGWWPLNNDVNDYSGNGNKGTPNSGVFFTTSWSDAYSAP
jgi:hypothetical protein